MSIEKQVADAFKSELIAAEVRIRGEVVRQLRDAVASVLGQNATKRPSKSPKRPRKARNVMTVTATGQKSIRVPLSPPAGMVKRHRRTKLEMLAVRASKAAGPAVPECTTTTA